MTAWRLDFFLQNNKIVNKESSSNSNMLRSNGTAETWVQTDGTESKGRNQGFIIVSLPALSFC